MNEKSWSISCAGTYHQAQNIPCGDYSNSGEKNGMKFIIVADGAGSLENSREGAEIAGKAIVEYISENFERLFFEDTARVKYFVLSHISYRLKQKANERDLKTFGSTIVFMGIKENKYIMFHLGDGAILAGEENKYHIISKPMNGETSKYTWLTTTKDAYKFARFDRGLAKERFYVAISDGCYNMFENVHSGLIYWNTLTNKNADENIKRYIESGFEDDFSFSVMAV